MASKLESKLAKFKAGKEAESVAAALGEYEGGPTTTSDEDGLVRSVIIDKTTKARSVAELLKLINLPPETADPAADTDWRVEEYRCNPSDVSLNLKSIGKVLRVTNYHQRLVVRNRRIKPTMLDLPQAVTMVSKDVRNRTKATPVPGVVERELIIPDPQFGMFRQHNTDVLHRMHDVHALSIVVQIAEKYGPTGITCLGDYYDLPMFQSKFPRGPELAYLTQHGINEGAFFAYKMRRIQDAWDDKHKREASGRVRILRGNHDQRMMKSIIECSPEASWLRPVNDPDGPPMLSLERLMDVTGLGVEWVGQYPDGVIVWNSNIWGKHGDVVRPDSGGTVVAELKKAILASVVFGHIHRDEHAWITTHGPLPDGTFGQRERMAASPGCVCRIDGAVPSQSKRNNWQQSVATLEYEVGGREFFEYNSHRIQGGRSIYNGEIYESKEREYVEEMVEWLKAAGWKNYDAHYKAASQ